MKVVQMKAMSEAWKSTINIPRVLNLKMISMNTRKNISESESNISAFWGHFWKSKLHSYSQNLSNTTKYLKAVMYEANLSLESGAVIVQNACLSLLF